MKARLARISWQAFFLLLAFSFADSTHQIAIGAFDQVGLPLSMVSMERVGNAFASAGWFIVFILSLRKHPLIAPELCWFLSGMLFFDVQTTWPLDMPLPPYFVIWGTVLALVQLMAGFSLENKRNSIAPVTGAIAPFRFSLWRLVIALPVTTFSLSALGLINGDFDHSGLPALVLPLHAWVNAFEALGWLTLLLSFKSDFLNRNAHRLAAFLSGMWFWDMVTTINLSMPVPPQQIIWGPVSIAVMLIVTYQFYRESQQQSFKPS